MLRWKSFLFSLLLWSGLVKASLLVLVISSEFTHSGLKHCLTCEGSEADLDGASLAWVCLFYVNTVGYLSTSSSPTGPPLQIWSLSVTVHLHTGMCLGLPDQWFPMSDVGGVSISHPLCLSFASESRPLILSGCCLQAVVWGPRLPSNAVSLPSLLSTEFLHTDLVGTSTFCLL